ncbi:hypothetical protein Taro_036688 [Colocasia esculenta]|uniref:Auxilin-related protein 2 n=1 Tax=Colocasia esculenta TaxID=4460 RepID=A0A843WME2_COLES|nr:hypothetical protein [Colocasia esculenta]
MSGMDQFPGLLARDFGLRPQGKAAPMAAQKMYGRSAARSGPGVGSSPLPGDLFGGQAGQQSNHRAHRDDEVDAFFGGGRGAAGASSTTPVYDKPVYDDEDDIFGGLPGTKKKNSSTSTAARHGDVFGSYGDADLLADLGGPRSVADNKRSGPAYDPSSPPYDGDLLGGLGGLGESKASGTSSSNPASPPYDNDLLSDLAGGKSSRDNERSGGGFRQSPPSYEDDLFSGLGGVSKPPGNEKRFEEHVNSSFDDLIPGFGGSKADKQEREPLESNHQHSSFSSTKSTGTGAEDPFVVLETASATVYSASGLFTDPLEHIKPSGSLKSDVSSATDGRVFDEINGFGGSTRSASSFSFNMENIHKDKNPLEAAGDAPAAVALEKAHDNILPKTDEADNDQDSYQTLFGKSSKVSESYKAVNGDGSSTEDANATPFKTKTKTKASQRPEENSGISDDIWLSVYEIPLFTQPTNAPPPSRPPPLFRTRTPFVSTDENSSIDSNSRTKSDELSSQQSSYSFLKPHKDTLKPSAVSSIDELEDFAMGKPQDYSYEMPSGEEEVDTTSAAAASAAAMKEAMDRAEAKFKHAREAWGREKDFRSSKNRESVQQARDEEEKEKGRLEREQEQREKEEKANEQRRLEKMREMELEREREREKGRQAVERANREARERAAAEARQKAERAARERAERAAVQRAQAEARERAAAEAKERAERLASERERAEAEARERAAAEVRAARERAAREKAAAEARGKAERAAVERAAAEVRARAQRAAVERAATEARERAAAEARERAAAMAREKQQRSDTDLDSFFGMSARANSAPRERSSSYESAFETQFQNNGKPAGTHKTSGSSSSMRKPSSTMNIMDDLTTVFRTPSNDEFQEIEGEPEERRRARLEREQRTRERAAKAVAEKNEREMQMQREQAERDRVSESLNTEIRRWASGKEGNLRALLSTLQYVG